MTKQCIKCKEIKELPAFGKNKRRKDGHNLSCLDCNRERLNANARRWYQANPERGLAIAHKWKAANPDKHNNSLLQSRYGITLDQKKQMLVDQGYKCTLCQRHQDKLKRNLVVDHCHATGKIRSLLCDPCNAAIGFINENLETAIRIVEYIKIHKGVSNGNSN